MVSPPQSVTDEAASDIEKDLARTFPSMRRFAGQEGQQALRRVLLAYAAYDPEVQMSAAAASCLALWQSVVAHRGLAIVLLGGYLVHGHRASAEHRIA